MGQTWASVDDVRFWTEWIFLEEKEVQANAQCPDTGVFAVVAFLEDPFGYHDFQRSLDEEEPIDGSIQGGEIYLEFVKIVGLNGRSGTEIDETQTAIGVAVENVLRFTISMPDAE